MERENIGKKRDFKLEEFKSNLDSLGDKTQKEELKVQFAKIMELIFLVDAEKGLENHNKNKIIRQLFSKILENLQKKQIKNIALSFGLGFLFALFLVSVYIVYYS